MNTYNKGLSKTLPVVEVDGNNTVLQDESIIGTDHFTSLCGAPQVGKTYSIAINDLNEVTAIQEVSNK